MKCTLWLIVVHFFVYSGVVQVHVQSLKDEINHCREYPVLRTHLDNLYKPGRSMQ